MLISTFKLGFHTRSCSRSSKKIHPFLSIGVIQYVGMRQLRISPDLIPRPHAFGQVHYVMRDFLGFLNFHHYVQVFQHHVSRFSEKE